MNIERLKKIHRYTGVVLATFFLFHIVNHLFAWGGPDTHICVQAISGLYLSFFLLFRIRAVLLQVTLILTAFIIA